MHITTLRHLFYCTLLAKLSVDNSGGTDMIYFICYSLVSSIVESAKQVDDEIGLRYIIDYSTLRIHYNILREESCDAVYSIGSVSIYPFETYANSASRIA